jgi:type II secretory pathway pseudopilin PulG
MSRRHVSRTRPRLRGFTLLETALALVIIITGILAIMEAQGAFIRSNVWSSHEATATYLANEIRERMRSLPRHDPVTGLQLVGPPGNQVVVGLGPETGEVTVDDFDDIDDYNTVLFGLNGTFPGPIDAFGQVIPEVDANGNVVMGPNGPVSLIGWSQYVLVEKVNPFNLADVRPWSEEVAPVGSFAGRKVDQYPLRVTVTVFYQGPYDPQPQAVTRMSWVTPY